MSITSTTNKVAYNGNGATTSFAFSYPVRDDDDITVIVRNETTGAETTLVDGTTCSVTVAADFTSATVDTSGGSAPYGTLTTSEQLIINRSTPYTNNLNFRNHDGLLAEVLDEAVDRLEMECQRLQEQIDRCLKLQISEDSTNPDITFSTQLPTVTGINTSGKYIKITSDGDATPVYTMSYDAGTFPNGVYNDAATSTDNAVARFNGTTGYQIQNSGVIIDDSDNLTGVTSINIGATIAITGVLDEDNMASDSAVKLATQQSIKAYVDTAVAAVPVGDVVGPASATDNAITRFDLTTGKLIQNSGCTIDDSNNMTVGGDLNVTGADINTGDGTLLNAVWNRDVNINALSSAGEARVVIQGSDNSTVAPAALILIDSGSDANDRVFFVSMGQTRNIARLGTDTDAGGTPVFLLDFDTDANTIVMRTGASSTAALTINSTQDCTLGGSMTLIQGEYLGFQNSVAGASEDIHSHVAGVLNISSRAGTHFYMDTDNNQADTVKQIIFYNNATRAAGGATEVASLTGGGALSCVGNINTSGVFNVDSVQVVSNRVTGWSNFTGTSTRANSGLDTSTATTAQVAEALRALIADLTTHGLIGA